MEHVGIDLDKAQSQVPWATDDGEIRQQRIRATRELLVVVFERMREIRPVSMA